LIAGALIDDAIADSPDRIGIQRPAVAAMAVAGGDP